MNKKYIMLINQLNQGYHMTLDELNDLKMYLESQLRQIELKKGSVEKWD